MNFDWADSFDAPSTLTPSTSAATTITATGWRRLTFASSRTTPPGSPRPSARGGRGLRRGREIAGIARNTTTRPTAMPIASITPKSRTGRVRLVRRAANPAIVVVQERRHGRKIAVAAFTDDRTPGSCGARSCRSRYASTK